MQDLFSNNLITESFNGQALVYFINDDAIYNETSFKVLKGLTNSGFVKCSQSSWAGTKTLMYATDFYKKLSDIMSLLTPESFLIIVDSLIDTITASRENGFIQYENIFLNYERIFVDVNNYKTGLIYLPVKSGMAVEYSDFEVSFRKMLIWLIRSYPNISNKSMKTICGQLENNMMTLETISNNLFGKKSVKIINNKNEAEYLPQPQQQVPESFVMPTLPEVKSNISKKKAVKQKENIVQTGVLPELDGLILCGTNTPELVEINITNRDVLIGRLDDCDIQLTFNDAIGRHHCKIISKRNNYFLIDLDSKNGTYINNGSRLKPNKKYSIQKGDIIRLANSEFVLR